MGLVVVRGAAVDAGGVAEPLAAVEPLAALTALWQPGDVDSLPMWSSDLAYHHVWEQVLTLEPSPHACEKRRERGIP